MKVHEGSYDENLGKVSFLYQLENQDPEYQFTIVNIVIPPQEKLYSFLGVYYESVQVEMLKPVFNDNLLPSVLTEVDAFLFNK